MSARVLVIAEQLHAPTPGGIGVFTAEVCSRIAEVTQGSGVAAELYASAGGEGDPILDYGLGVHRSRLSHRVLMRLWDRGLVKGPRGFDACVSLSMAGPIEPRVRAKAFTLYDMAFREVPETFTRRGIAWHERRFAAIANSTARVITISEASRDALIRAGIAPERIVMAVPGADHLPTADQSGAEVLLERLGVRSPFLLAVGTLEPRKNLVRVAQAASICRGELGGEFPLVVVGPRGWNQDRLPPAGVVLAGKVSPGVLAGLYRRASALVYAPLYEGFGLPPVEAMASCTPVVASGIPSVTPDVAELVDPLSAADIARGVVRVLSDDRRKSELVREGLARAGSLKWDRTARCVIGAAS